MSAANHSLAWWLKKPDVAGNMKTPLISKIFALSIIFALILPATSMADNVQTDAMAYVLGKFESHDIVFLGVRHQQERIETFNTDLMPYLRKAGVSHICLEIPSDQQANLDYYLQTGLGLSGIQLWPPIDCPEYRGFLESLRGKSLVPVAIDLPVARLKENITRDEYMAQIIADIHQGYPDRKSLVILGNSHVLKKLDWEDHVPSSRDTIYQYLNAHIPGIRMFLINQVIGHKPEECDFTRFYSETDGIVAMDCTKKFTGWKLRTLSIMAIKETEVCDMIDGLLVY